MKTDLVSVIGLGYIGLPLAAVVANLGVQVIGVDINRRVVDSVNSGSVPISEPGLEGLVFSAVREGNLICRTSPQQSDVFVIAVPTPLKSEKNGSRVADLSFVKEAVRSISPHLKKGDLVILESTCPVGTTDQLVGWIKEFRVDLMVGKDADGDGQPDVHIAYCPERIIPGSAIHELVHNDRVIGGITKSCSIKAEVFYKRFLSGRTICTDARTAEMVKLTENASRDVQLAFANELSLLCDAEGVDVWELIALANRHPRVNILTPGPGVGGHCIAVDPWFLIQRSPSDTKLMTAARLVNDSKPQWVVSKIMSLITKTAGRLCERSAADLTVACLGLTFKADVDDFRGSPALQVAEMLSQSHPGKLVAVEPNLESPPSDWVFSVLSLEEAVAQADIFIVLVEHKEFRNLKLPADAVIYDTKGLWSKFT